MDPMPAPNHLRFCLSALAILASTPAFALTAEELWAEWQAQSAAMDQVVTATEVVPGNGMLTLNGFSSTYSDGEVATVGRIEQIVMTEAGDGSVTVTMSDTYAITFTFEPGFGEPPVNLGMNILMPDLVMSVSGEVGSRLYDYSAPRITIEEGEISGGGGPPPTIDLMIAMEDFAATYRIDGTDPADMAYASSSRIAGMVGALDVTPPPGEEGQLKVAFSLGAMEGEGEGRLGNLIEAGANPDLVPAGFDLRGAFAYESLNYEFTFQSNRDAFSMFYGNDGGRIAATFSEAEIDYAMSATGTRALIMGTEIPVPIDISVGSAEIGLRMPLAASPEPQTLSARLAYRDVVMGDGIWGMFDPAQAIPRDPISVVADLSGTAVVTANLLAMDPETMGAPPGELRDMTLHELRISVGGATLTGSGSANFAPGPIPMPVGSVDLQLSGGNGLLDRLQTAGLVPIEQLAMVRGMLGAFARPGAMPDTLESTIEFTEGGGISANGIPLQ
jgi:hypothetical protein